MLHISGDDMRATTRNIVFLITTGIILGCMYGIYFELSSHVRNESLYLGLFIVSNLLFATYLGIILYDSFTDRDYKIEKKYDKSRGIEINNYHKENKHSNIPTDELGKDKNYYNNAFEKNGNTWRTLLFAGIALIIYLSFIVVYTKQTNKKDNPGYIVAITIATLVMAFHIGMLIYQAVEVFKLDKTPTKNSVAIYLRKEEQRNKVHEKNIRDNEQGY